MRRVGSAGSACSALLSGDDSLARQLAGWLQGNAVVQLKRLGAALAIALLAAQPSRATPIEFHFWGTVSGSIGTTVFENTAISIVVYADTGGSIPWSNSTTFGWQNFSPSGIVSGSFVTLDNIGTAIINPTSGLMIVANPNAYCECIGLGPRVIGGAEVFNLRQTPFTLNNPYDLTTGTGLVSGTIFPVPSNALRTTLGDLRITSGFNGQFQAVLVPLPASAWFLGGALGVILGARQRRRGRGRDGRAVQARLSDIASRLSPGPGPQSRGVLCGGG